MNLCIISQYCLEHVWLQIQGSILSHILRNWNLTVKNIVFILKNDKLNVS